MLKNEEPQTLKVAEVARRLRVDPRTVYRMIRRGELHGVKAGRVWRVPTRSLEAFLQAADAGAHLEIPAGAPNAKEPLSPSQSREERATRVKAVRGKYRAVLSSVDDFISRKQEEIAWENRRWSSDE
jgi:excisionase family DNA binding protein